MVSLKSIEYGCGYIIIRSVYISYILSTYGGLYRAWELEFKIGFRDERLGFRDWGFIG